MNISRQLDDRLLIDYREIGLYVHILHILFNIFGLCGSLASCLTFCNRRTKSSTFADSPALIYFRTISLLEIGNNLLILESSFRFLSNRFSNERHKNFVWTWFGVHLETPTTNLISLIIDLLIIFVSVERAIACLLPVVFDRLNRIVVVRSVIAAAVSISATLFVPTMFDSLIERRSIGDREKIGIDFASWRFSIGYERFLKFQEYFLFFVALCTLGSAWLACTGVWKAAGRRRRLRPPTPSFVDGSQLVIEAKKTLSSADWNLCCLQLTQSLPAALNYVVYIARAALFRYFVSNVDQKRLQSITRSIAYLDSAAGFTHDFCHCSHFYFYFFFSRSFRDAFRGFVLRRIDLKCFRKRKSTQTQAETS